jgi:hypothetical protein
MIAASCHCVQSRTTMPNDESQASDIDWSLTTWDGARREQLRRWSQMPLAEMILALEEMHVLAEKLSQSSNPGVADASKA